MSNVKEFLKDYNELVDKHRITIESDSSCGCRPITKAVFVDSKYICGEGKYICVLKSNSKGELYEG